MSATKTGVPGNGHAHQGNRDDVIGSVVLGSSRPESTIPSLPAIVGSKSIACRAIQNLRELRQKAKEIKTWMTDEAYPFFFAVDGEVADNGDSLLLDQEFEEGSATTIGQVYVEYKTRIQEYLTSPHVPIRCAAHSARLVAYFSQPALPFEAFSALIDDLVEKGYFVANANGAIKVWERRFSLSQANKLGQMGEEEEQAIASLIAEQTARLDAEFHEANVKKAEQMAQKATITPDVLLRPGKKGICFLYAPPQAVPATSTREAYTVSEAWLLVELSAKGMIFVLEAIGSQHKCRELKSMSDREVGVKASTLAFKAPPDYRSFQQAGFTEEQTREIRRLWNLVKHGIDYWREYEEPRLREAALEKAEAHKAELAQKATISASQFFSSDKPSLGIALLEYKTDWLEGKERFVMFFAGLLYFLIERFEYEGMIGVRLVETPTHLVDFFEVCQGDHLCGEEYEGVPSPLQKVLRAISRQFNKEQDAKI